jgi:hypothetical protein
MKYLQHELLVRNESSESLTRLPGRIDETDGAEDGLEGGLCAFARCDHLLKDNNCLSSMSMISVKETHRIQFKHL